MTDRARLRPILPYLAIKSAIPDIRAIPPILAPTPIPALVAIDIDEEFASRLSSFGAGEVDEAPSDKLESSDFDGAAPFAPNSPVSEGDASVAVREGEPPANKAFPEAVDG